MTTRRPPSPAGGTNRRPSAGRAPAARSTAPRSTPARSAVGRSEVGRSTSSGAAPDGAGDPGAQVPGSGRSPAGGLPVTRPRLARRGVIALVLVVMLGVLLAPHLRTWVQQRGEISAIEQEVAQRQDRVDTLQRQQERWKDPAYVAAQARERLHLVYPGETGYLVLPEDQAAAGSGQDAASGGSAAESGASGERGAADGDAAPNPASDGTDATRPWFRELMDSAATPAAAP